MNLTGLLSGALGGEAVGQISQAIGADESTTSNAIQAALPMLIGGLARNTQSEDGAASLLNAVNKDHDGSILDDLGGFLSGGAASGIGGAILGHILGGRQGQVEQGISAASGLDMSKVGPLLAMLAPVVMGALGKANQQQGGMDASSLAGLLGGAHQEMSAGSPILGMLGGLLDRNHDGSALDDILGMAGRMMSGR
ncbi:MAG: DUF937 domain-containing protein [Acidobacteria bacterium]|nr:DUF937 domain-containing protein [Acidobacteriota bacterium]MBI3425465.1 DUF937 domain-containing protein [Acidobacteriota bacterium]